jgi:hypothetical protein
MKKLTRNEMKEVIGGGGRPKDICPGGFCRHNGGIELGQLPCPPFYEVVCPAVEHQV